MARPARLVAPRWGAIVSGESLPRVLGLGFQRSKRSAEVAGDRGRFWGRQDPPPSRAECTGWAESTWSNSASRGDVGRCIDSADCDSRIGELRRWRYTEVDFGTVRRDAHLGPAGCVANIGVEEGVGQRVARRRC